ncbi:MAG: asparagine synthase (glutamine-hydrolyzing), partial [Verrucomicrobiota bacterium]
MCGITGFFSSQPLDGRAQGVLDQMIETLNHRGPDAKGVHLEPQRGVAFGHARLSINDLEHGEQPIVSQNSRYVLTVNGEFYDFKKYRSRLMAEGDRFSCKSDSEIAIGLYRKYGLKFFEHLRGEFAFCLYDKEADELLLARDRFGIRPMFFHCDGQTLIYGSEVKSVLAHPSVEARLDPKAAMNQLMQVMVPGSSAFENVHALYPGHFMRVRKRDGRLEVETHRYWDLDFPEAEAHRGEVDEQSKVEEIRERLIEAIVLRLEADVPVGAYLSGGIDSCCILGLASGAMQSPVKAFTISFDSDAYDEAAIAIEMAKSMEADQEIITLKADDLYGDNYINTVWHAERTFYNTLGVAKNLMSRRVKECGYKSVQTG